MTSSGRQVPGWLQSARDQWTNRGTTRPPFAHEPADGQESVWDYPRPPALVADQRLVEVHDGERLVARSSSTLRLCETSHPPTFYVPLDDCDLDVLTVVDGPTSFCEWKGPARYWSVPGVDRPVAWDYPSPYEEYADIAGHVAFYPALVRCTVAGEVVRPQAGGFYGGWITDDVVGPFKGEPGTNGW